MSSYDFQQGWTLDPEAPSGSPEAKAPYTDNGTGTFDPSRYYSADYMEKEWRQLWTKVWTVAGFTCDIPEVGDYFTYDIGRESFIVVRTGTNTSDIEAFYNVCQHRGNRLVQNSFGHVDDTFTCSFHSWQWHIDGALKTIMDRETFREEVICDNLDLSAVHCDVWGSMVFINLAKDPQPLLDFLDVIPEQLNAYQLDKMITLKTVESEWGANWKTVQDAFLESYHVPTVHPEALSLVDQYHMQWDLYENGMSRMLQANGVVSPRYPDHETVNNELREMLSDVGLDPDEFRGLAGDVRRAIQETKRSNPHIQGIDYDNFSDNQLTDNWNYSIFPNVALAVHLEAMLVMRFRPHPTDPERSTFEMTVLAHPVDDPAYNLPFYMGIEKGQDLSGQTPPERLKIGPGEPGLSFVLEQDSVLVPFVQQGVRSDGYKGAHYGEQEQRARHFHRELDRYIDTEK